jgi:hypothetical protein
MLTCSLVAICHQFSAVSGFFFTPLQVQATDRNLKERTKTSLNGYRKDSTQQFVYAVAFVRPALRERHSISKSPTE